MHQKGAQRAEMSQNRIPGTRAHFSADSDVSRDQVAPLNRAGKYLQGPEHKL